VGHAPSVYWPCAVPGQSHWCSRAQVEAPVFLEVAVADHGAQGEDGLGAVQAPSCSADVEPVADQVSAGLSQAWRLLGGLAPPRLDGAALRAWSEPGWIKVAMESASNLPRQAPC
jgi:hypothetical protein